MTGDVPMVFDTGGYPSIYMDMAVDLVCESYNRDILDLVATPLLEPDEVNVVWFSKTLKHWKALLSTERNDGRYYELAYNGEKKETYLNVYRKIKNEVIPDNQR